METISRHAVKYRTEKYFKNKVIPTLISERKVNLNAAPKGHQTSSFISIFLSIITRKITEGKNQTLVGAIPFCGEYPGPRFEDKFRSANQIDGISIADGGKMADS